MVNPVINDVKLTIRRIRARAVSVPRPKAVALGGGGVTHSALILVDLETEQGVTGSSYVYCTMPLAQKPVTQFLLGLSDPLQGESALPFALRENLNRRFRLLGTQGVTALVLSALDIASWDALTKAANLPLVRFLGGEPRRIPAYTSFGIGLIGPERAARGACSLLEPGFGALKVRLGYPNLGAEIDLIRAVRQSVGDEIKLMCDYNQSLTVQEAIRRCRRLDDEELVWIEEPTLATNYEALAAVAREAKTPIQAGENCWSPMEMSRSLAIGAADFFMPDASRIGGVTGWMQASALADANGVPLSSHLMPELSAHLLSVSPTCHWLEYVDWASPILKEPLQIDSGFAVVSDSPGIGLDWNESAVQQYLVT